MPEFGCPKCTEDEDQPALVTLKIVGTVFVEFCMNRIALICPRCGFRAPQFETTVNEDGESVPKNHMWIPLYLGPPIRDQFSDVPEWVSPKRIRLQDITQPN